VAQFNLFILTVAFSQAISMASAYGAVLTAYFGKRTKQSETVHHFPKGARWPPG